MKMFLVFWVLMLSTNILFGQETSTQSLTLKYIYERVEGHYPVSDKFEIEDKIAELNDRLAQSGLLPDIQLNTNARYQSEVTEFPISTPGIDTPTLSKDQYNISLNLTQSLYDGGKTRAQRALEKEKSEIENAVVSSTMWEIRSLAEDVYFGILTLQKKQEAIQLLKKDITDQLESIQSKIENGVLLPGNGLVLEAELIKIKQQEYQISYEIKAAFEILSELIGGTIDQQTTLEVPKLDLKSLKETAIKRPELQVFDHRIKSLDLQKNLVATDRLPKVTAYAKGAYGRPGFNVFDDDLHLYGTIGIQAQWSFKGWNNAYRKSQVLELQKKKIQSDETAFLIGIRSELHKTEQNIKQLQEQISLDAEIVKIREQVVTEKQNLLEEGVITSTEYLTALNAAAQVMVDMELRKLRLTKVRIQYLTLKGETWN